MNYTDYEVTIPYPTKPSKPILSSQATANDTRKFADVLEQYEKDMEVYNAQRLAYGVEQNRMGAKFKADALEEAGLTGHPKADKAYSLAWEDGHSSGYSEVMNHLYKYADLLLN